MKPTVTNLTLSERLSGFVATCDRVRATNGPYGHRAKVMAKVALLLLISIKKTTKWITIIASVLFGTGLLVAVATHNTSLLPTLIRLAEEWTTKDPSSMPEVLPLLEPTYLPALKKAGSK